MDTNEIPLEQPSRKLDAGIPDSSNPGKRGGKIVAIIIGSIITILIFGGGAFAYIQGWIPNPFQRNLSSDEVLSRMFNNTTSIESLEYAYSLSFVSESRTPGAKSIADTLPELKVKATALANDQKRLQSISSMQALLGSQRGQYPVDIGSLGGSYFSSVLFDQTKDPLTGRSYDYQQTEGGTGYVLSIVFETDAGLSAYEQALKEAGGAKINEATKTSRTIKITQSTPDLTDLRLDNANSLLAQTFQSEKLYRYMPVEVRANIQSSGMSQTSSVLDSNTQIELTGSLELGDTSFNLGGEYRKVGFTNYFMLTRAPSLGFFDLAALKNKWLRYSPDEDGYASDFLPGQPTSGDEQEDSYLKFARLYQIFLEELGNTNVLKVVHEFPKESDDQLNLYHYEVQLDPENVGTFYKNFLKRAQKEFADDEASGKEIDELATYLESSEFKQLQDAANQKSTIEIWIDDENFWPRKLKATSSIVPPSEVQKLKEIQYRVNYEINLPQINQPIVIEEPTGSMTWEEAQHLLFGEQLSGRLNSAKGNADQARVKSNISQMRVLAEYYYDANNSSYAGLSECILSPSITSCAGGIEESVAALNKDLAGTSRADTLFRVNSSINSFCMSYPLGDNDIMCIDNSGAQQGATANCNGSSFSCTGGEVLGTKSNHVYDMVLTTANPNPTPDELVSYTVKISNNDEEGRALQPQVSIDTNDLEITTASDHGRRGTTSNGKPGDKITWNKLGDAFETSVEPKKSHTFVFKVKAPSKVGAEVCVEAETFGLPLLVDEICSTVVAKTIVEKKSVAMPTVEVTTPTPVPEPAPQEVVPVEQIPVVIPPVTEPSPSATSEPTKQKSSNTPIEEVGSSQSEELSSIVARIISGVFSPFRALKGWISSLL